MSKKVSLADATIDDVRDFWQSHVNNEYYTEHARATTEYFDQISERRYRWHYHLREYFDGLAGSSGRLLEIGCGIGVDSVELVRCGFDVTAVDLTGAAIEVARQHAEYRGLDIDFGVANAEALPFDDAEFDAVFSFGVLHHTPAIDQAIAEVHRVLRPGGTAHIMLYSRSSLVDWVHRAFNLPYESPRHLDDHCPIVYRLTKKEVAGLFSPFTSTEVWSAYPFTYGFRYLTFWIPVSVRKALGRRLGWHLMIRATK